MRSTANSVREAAGISCRENWHPSTPPPLLAIPRPDFLAKMSCLGAICLLPPAMGQSKVCRGGRRGLVVDYGGAKWTMGMGGWIPITLIAHFQDWTTICEPSENFSTGLGGNKIHFYTFSLLEKALERHKNELLNTVIYHLVMALSSFSVFQWFSWHFWRNKNSSFGKRNFWQFNTSHRLDILVLGSKILA